LISVILTQIVIEFLEKSVSLVDHDPFQPVGILGGRQLCGERYYIVNGVSPGSNNQRLEIVSGSFLKMQFPEVCTSYNFFQLYFEFPKL